MTDIKETYFQKALSKEKRAVRMDYYDMNFQTDFSELVDFIDKYFTLRDNKLLLKNQSKKSVYDLEGELVSKSRGILSASDYIEKNGREVGFDFSSDPLRCAALKDLSVALKDKYEKEAERKRDVKEVQPPVIPSKPSVDKTSTTIASGNSSHMSQILHTLSEKSVSKPKVPPVREPLSFTNQTVFTINMSKNGR